MKRGWVMLVLSTVAACAALPSAIPLADTGGAARPPVPSDRDRRASRGAKNGEAGEAGEVVAVTVEPKAPSDPAASDAGAPDSGGALPSETAATPPQWPGEYYGSDRFVRRIDSRPDDVQVDDKARTRVEQPSPSSLVISVVNSLTGDVICALKAGVQGSEATLERDQTCFGGGDVEAVVTSGRAKIAGDLLTLDFEGEVEVAGEEDEDDASGKDTYHFEGRRR